MTCVGAGYVGALTAITMAVKNPSVQFIVCDINESLIARWNQGNELPFYEPQLDEYYRRAVTQNKNIVFTTDVNHAMRDGHIIIIAVNTPARTIEEVIPNPEGALASRVLGCPTNMDAFVSVVCGIGSNLVEQLKTDDCAHKIIVEKSTVPLGTANEVK